MIKLTLDEVESFSTEVVEAVAKYTSVVVYYSPHHAVFRYGPPGGAAAERAVNENRMVGVYQRGVDEEEVYTDCMYYLSSNGIQLS